MVVYLKKSNHCQGLLAPRLVVFVMLLCMSIIPSLGNAMANSPPCVPVGDWKVPDDGSKISETQLLNDLHKRPVVMLGETHTSAEHHKWQLHVL